MCLYVFVFVCVSWLRICAVIKTDALIGIARNSSPLSPWKQVRGDGSVCHSVCVSYVPGWKTKKAILVLTFGFLSSKQNIHTLYPHRLYFYYLNLHVSIPLYARYHTSLMANGFVSVQMCTFASYVSVHQCCLTQTWPTTLNAKQPHAQQELQIFKDIFWLSVRVFINTSRLPSEGNWSRGINFQIKIPSTQYSNWWIDISMNE